MAIHITGAPCCWGVDDVKNPYLPKWQTVLYEAGQAGYKAIELGPYGYLPLDIDVVSHELKKNNIGVVAGTIFDDLLAEKNYGNVLGQVDDICGIITKLPKLPTEEGQRYPAPYLTVMDWGHDERDFAAGHPDKAPRLGDKDWDRMMSHIRGIAKRAAKWEVRAVVHPHAGGYLFGKIQAYHCKDHDTFMSFLSGNFTPTFTKDSIPKLRVIYQATGLYTNMPRAMNKHVDTLECILITAGYGVHILGGAWSLYDRGIDDASTMHDETGLIEALIYIGKYILRNVMIFKEISKLQ